MTVADAVPQPDIEIRQRMLTDVLALAQPGEHPERLNTVYAWHSRMQNASRSGDRFKVAYYALYSIISLAAASVPALIAAAGSSDVATANAMRFIAAGLGVLVAVATAVLGVVQLGNRWRVYRTYSLALEDAGWDYLGGAGGADAYAVFDKAVNKARIAFEREYLTHVAVQPDVPAPGAAAR